jgi:hypothetical protein
MEKLIDRKSALQVDEGAAGHRQLLSRSAPNLFGSAGL